MKEKNLKPCPFCGGKAEFFTSALEDSYRGIYCRICSAETSADTERDAEIKWNARQPAINWQPIETIPKGRYVILLGTDGSVVKGKFDHTTSDSIYIDYKILHGTSSACSIKFFNGWAELPEVSHD